MTEMLNFAGLPAEYSNLDSAKIIVITVPYGRTSTWIKGADKGPKAIIEASANLELYDIETDSQPYLNGIYTDNGLMESTKIVPEKMVEQVRKRVQRYIEQEKFVVLIGGEHSVSIGSIEAHAKKYHNMTVLQLDAHTDLRNEYSGSKYNHACVMARVKEVSPIVQVGIRSMDSSEKEFLDKDTVFWAQDIYNNSNWFGDVVSKLSEKVYITIDLDVFDCSVMPSTGTPEPGGLFWYDVLALLKTVSEIRDIVGFDVVELCPNESNKAPDFLAAKLIHKLLSYKFRG